ncbi:MAG: hypothetical protein GZ086_04700 [Gelidibacter sp.]|nr:hypothetical protein [Gelidibacter sp.]
MGRNYFFYVALLLTIAITVGSLISFKNGLGIGVLVSDKILHASGYFILTLSWLLAYGVKSSPMKSTILIASAVFIYGIIIEILQGLLTDYRQADLYDVFANLSGILVSIIFFVLVLKKN